MRHKLPIYVSKEVTVLSQDPCIPYGGRMEIVSESKREELALKLLGSESEDELFDPETGKSIDELIESLGISTKWVILINQDGTTIYI